MLSPETPFAAAPAVANRRKSSADDVKLMLERAYGVDFTLIDGQTGEVLHESTGQPSRDWSLPAEMCREVARRQSPEFLDDEEPLVTLALPLVDAPDSSTVAVATFLTRPIEPGEDISRQLELLGISDETGSAWATQQTPWPADTLKRISDLVLDGIRTARKAKELQQEADSLSTNLASTYEEISLLYRLTQNLKLSKSDRDLGQIALDWLAEVVPASGLALQLLPIEHREKSQSNGIQAQSVLLCHGDCPIDNARFSGLIQHLDPNSHRRPIVVNRPVTQQPDWPYPEIRELIATPLVEGENVFGWLVALNHAEDGEFGTIEASLLSSVAAILGIHSGNIDLYRQQSELLAGIVRALTSAIDAKDPYTCGHSDRVSRVAVRLAQELGCDEKTLNMLCLAGLLHDIGKIGVSDSVLRKPAKLSDEEYEHIKQHVSTGHRILHDLVKLEGVLPVVLHHHESWDGSGYPLHLGASEIPLSARIVAVADAFDAMTSNRPYRKGMPDEKVDQILRNGAGQQWDPEVIEAFFRARDDIRQIVQEEEPPTEAADKAD
jgi:putative nucleotidyltransferase with HDIG domain